MDSNHTIQVMEQDMSNRQTFECYLYDYLVKRNMHQTAEVFRNETNLQLDQGAASSDVMDVPEGFMREWWSLNYDFDPFREWVHVNEQHDVESMHGCNASQEARSPINEEVLNQLPDNFTPNEAFIVGSNAMASDVTSEFPLIFVPSPNREVRGELPQRALQSSHEGELITSTMRMVDAANTNGLLHKQFNQNAPKTIYTGFTKEIDHVLESLLKTFWSFEENQPSLLDKPSVGESNRNVEDLLAYGEGNNMNEFAGSPQTLSIVDNNNETSDVSNNFQTTTTGANNLIGEIQHDFPDILRGEG